MLEKEKRRREGREQRGGGEKEKEEEAEQGDLCLKKGLRIYLSEPPGGPSRQKRQVRLGAANGPRVASHHRHLMGMEEKVSMKIKRPVYTVGSADEPLPSA